MRWLLLCLVVVLLAGCDESPRTSQWGAVRMLAQAEQTHAPALAVNTAQLAAVWVSVEDGDIFPYSRTPFTEPVSLPLPPVYPHDHQLHHAQDGGYHLFWLDARFDDPDGATYLWTVYMNAKLQAQRGQVQLSEIQSGKFAVIDHPDRTATVVWSEYATDEPALHIRTVDALGRPRPAALLVSDARNPVLVRRGGRVDLFWLRASDGQVMRGQLVDDTLMDITPLTAPPAMTPADYLHDFQVGFDQNTTYLLWNITRSGRVDEVWMAHSTGETWSQARQLGVGDRGEIAFQTGFNGGMAQATTSGDNGLRWATPLSGQFESLVVAGQVEDELVLLYLQAGEVVAVQPIISLTHNLIGRPSLVTDRDRHLYLAWAEPTDAGYANLNLTTTKY